MVSRLESRLQFVEVRGERPKSTFCQLVDEGLGTMPKSLPTCYLYDHRGSELFEEITRLPEYYPTRTEQSILERHALDIVEAVGDGMCLIEFGSGSSLKTRILIEAALCRQQHLQYVPIDISTDFLKASAQQLLDECSRLSILALGAEYFEAIEALPDHDGPRLILFLGSNIGNMENEEAIEFLSQVRQQMNPMDRVLVGVDLVKDRSVLEAAYNDSQGVTAEFNRNLLRRINGELDGNFDLACFHHMAPYDDRTERIEMRLYSTCRQAVEIEATGRIYEFAAGEFIHTEWSHKYTRDSFARLCASGGLEIDSAWTDERDWFSTMLLKPTML